MAQNAVLNKQKYVLRAQKSIIQCLIFVYFVKNSYICTRLLTIYYSINETIFIFIVWAMSVFGVQGELRNGRK